MGKYCGQVHKYKNVQRSEYVIGSSGGIRYLTSYELNEWFENIRRIETERKPYVKIEEQHHEMVKAIVL